MATKKSTIMIIINEVISSLPPLISQIFKIKVLWRLNFYYTSTVFQYRLHLQVWNILFSTAHQLIGIMDSYVYLDGEYHL